MGKQGVGFKCASADIIWKEIQFPAVLGKFFTEFSPRHQ